MRAPAFQLSAREGGICGPVSLHRQVWPQFAPRQFSKGVAVVKGLVAAGTGNDSQVLQRAADCRRILCRKTNLRRRAEVGLLSLEDGRKNHYRRFGDASGPMFPQLLVAAFPPCVRRWSVAARPFPCPPGPKVVATWGRQLGSHVGEWRPDLWVPGDCPPARPTNGPVRRFIPLGNASHARDFRSLG